eukprot:3619868-Heterocapsa_arctica.AAC.1
MGGYIQAAPKLPHFAATRKFDLHDQQRRDYTVTRYLNYLFFAGKSSFAARADLSRFAFQTALCLRDPCELALARASLRDYGSAAPCEASCLTTVAGLATSPPRGPA